MCLHIQAYVYKQRERDVMMNQNSEAGLRPITLFTAFNSSAHKLSDDVYCNNICKISQSDIHKLIRLTERFTFSTAFYLDQPEHYDHLRVATQASLTRLRGLYTFNST